MGLLAVKEHFTLAGGSTRKICPLSPVATYNSTLPIELESPNIFRLRIVEDAGFPVGRHLINLALRGAPHVNIPVPGPTAKAKMSGSWAVKRRVDFWSGPTRKTLPWCPVPT